MKIVALALLAAFVLCTEPASAQAPPTALEKSRATAAMAAGGVEAFRSQLEALRNENARLREQNSALQQRLNTIGNATGEQSTSSRDRETILNLSRENAELKRRIVILASQPSTASKPTIDPQVPKLRDDNRRLQDTVDNLTKTNQDLRRTIDDTTERSKGAVNTLDKKVESLDRANADQRREIASLKDSQARAEERVRELEQKAATSNAAIADAERDRWKWAGLAGLIGAALAATAVRLWWTRSVHVVKPLSVSVGLGAWSMTTPPQTALPAVGFKVSTHWLPGPPQLHAPGVLVRPPTWRPYAGA